MRRFVTQLLIISFISLSIISLLFLKADGYTDPFYIRFTTPKQQNLILGTSRAAQGIQPRFFKEIMGIDIYNFSFTIGQSPYGQVYYDGIKRKFNHKGKDGVFILAVDPWSISSKTKYPNDSAHFRENNLCLGNTTIVNMKPNFQYLFNNFSGKYFDLLFEKKKTSMFLHKNGWLEITAKMDTSIVNKRIDLKVKTYRETNLNRYKYSSLRFEYLKKIILYLKDYGKVYLVRLPLHEKVMEIENELMPDFNKKINDIVPFTDGYLDMTTQNMKYNYTDGNHLYKKSGEVVTKEIIHWIQSH